MKTYGLQTFTVRKEMNKDLDLAIKSIHELGISDLEVARIKTDQHTIDVLKKYKMNVLSLQITLKKMMKKQDEIIHFCKSLNIKHIVISVLPIFAHLPLIGYSLFAKRVNQLMDMYLNHGLKISFHHHAYEMKQIKNDIRLSRILQSINPNLGLVIDTYWMTKMNQDPKAIYAKYEDRIIGIHLREYGMNGKHCTIGYGVVQFKELLQIIKPDVYQVIEQKTKSPYEDIKEALLYLEGIK